MDAEFLPAEIDRAALMTLARRSDRAGLVRLAGHAGTLVVTGGLVLLAVGRPLLLILAMALHGAALMFLFAPLHETIHRTAFRSRTLNDAVAFVCGLFLLLPPDYFRAFHFAHHRWTQDPARDPELAGGGRPAARGAFLLYLSGLPYWSWQARVLLRHAFGRVEVPFVSPAMRGRIVREARIVLGIYAAAAAASVAFASPILLLLWVGPALLGQPWLRAFLAAEHMLCPLTPKMERNTRTTLTAAPLRYYGWNMNYHAEHHLAPALPFHALPAAHDALCPNLQVTSQGYASVLREVWAAVAHRPARRVARQEPR